MATRTTVDWTPDAELAAKKHLAVHVENLRQEAENVARRSDSVSVSESYVTSAATHLRLAPKSHKAADLMQGVGTTFFGIGGGAIINAFQASSPNPVPFDSAMLLYVLLSVCGAVSAGVGYALKYGK
ncbi:hypothetical protein [Arthrobacter sp. NPDC093139]|uniref:hypothetical protein n=1 Tax=Arthrobacter sp. NPDC093139 TaxID=3363945 RepID=UPI00380E4F85